MTNSLRSQTSDTQAALVAALRAAADGERSALRKIFDCTSAKLMGICLRILKDREEAEDALQDTYVSVWQRAASFDPAKASPITWLATIARNRAIDRLRTRRRRQDPAYDVEALNAADDAADDAPDPFAEAAAAQESVQLQGCLAELESRTQRVIRAAFFDGLAYSQLAERAGVSLGTMKSWIRRGLQQLRKCLAS